MYRSADPYCSNLDNFAGLSYILIAKAGDVYLPPSLPNKWAPLPLILHSKFDLVRIPTIPDTSSIKLGRSDSPHGRILQPEITCSIAGQSEELEAFLSYWLDVEVFALVKYRASGVVRAFSSLRLTSENQSGDEPAQFIGDEITLRPASEQVYAWMSDQAPINRTGNYSPADYDELHDLIKTNPLL